MHLREVPCMGMANYCILSGFSLSTGDPGRRKLIATPALALNRIKDMLIIDFCVPSAILYP